MEVTLTGYYGANCSFRNLSLIDSLPDDILLDIFQKLDAQETQKKQCLKAVSRVSKRWYEVSSLSQVCLSISGFKGAKVGRILHRFSNLTSLNLSFLYDCSDEVLAQVGNNCPNLKYLQVSDSYKQNDEGAGLEVLARGCKKLESFSMHGYKGPDAPLKALGDCCRGLRQLRLRSAPFMGDEVIVNIAENCYKIEDLDLSFTEITDSSLTAIGKGLSHLRQLDLKHCKRVTGEGIAHVAAGCPRLQILHLGVVEVGDVGLAAIGQHSKLLEELYLDYGWGKWGKLSRDALAAVAKGCRSLKLLSLRGSKQVDDDVLQGLSWGCPALTSLDLHACERVGDAGLQAVMKGCKQLENLVLSGTAIGGSPGVPVTGGLPRLSTLRLNGDLISDVLLQAVAVNCKALSELYLGSCSKVTDSGLERVLKQCKNLKVLTAKNSSEINGSAFSLRCEKLESLNVQSCNIVDEGLASIAMSCTNVSQLSLQGCREVSAEALMKAVGKLPTLKELNIVGCTKIARDQVVAIIKAAKPSLKTVRVSRPDSPQDEYTISKRHGGWNLPSWARTASPPRPKLG